MAANPQQFVDANTNMAPVAIDGIAVWGANRPTMSIPQFMFMPAVPDLSILNGFADPLSQMFPNKKPMDYIMATDMPATIMVIGNSDSKVIYKTNKFILQTLTRMKMEKYQIIETFGKSHLFFFDERTKIYTLTGIIMDAFFGDVPTTGTNAKYKDKYMWAQSLQYFYDNHLRGTRLSENNRIAGLYVNNMFIKGYPLQLSINKESSTLPEGVQFSMAWAINDELLLTKTSSLQSLFDSNQANMTDTQTKIKQNLINDYIGLLNAYNDARTAQEALQSAKTTEPYVTVTARVQKAEEDLDKFIKANKFNMQYYSKSGITGTTAWD